MQLYLSDINWYLGSGSFYCPFSSLLRVFPVCKSIEVVEVFLCAHEIPGAWSSSHCSIYERYTLCYRAGHLAFGSVDQCVDVRFLS